MPKLFPISLEVEEVAVGRVLRALNSMTGVVRLHLNLTQDQSARLEGQNQGETEPTAPAPTPSAKWRSDGRINSRGLRPPNNIAYRTIAEVLFKTPAHYKILQAALQRIGSHHPQAIHGHLHRMTLLKLITRTSPGTYRLTEKGKKMFAGQEAASTHSRKLLSSNFYKVVDNRIGVRHLILKTLAKFEPPSMKGSALTKVLVGAGYSPKNLSTTGMKMRHEGLFEYNNGVYTLTPVGREALEVPSTAPEPKTLSSASNPEERTDHG